MHDFDDAEGERMSNPVGRVLVTGGSSGLGAAVVEAVQAHGGTAYVLDRVAPEAEVDSEIVDISDTRAAEAAVRAVAERAGGLVAVVSAGGIDRCGRGREVAAG